MMDRRVLCLSAGQLQPKKPTNALAYQHLYLNYGLLGLASVLAQRGYAPRVFHGRFDTPEMCVDHLAVQGYLSTQAPILLSLPSAFSLPWAQRACAQIKSLAPNARIVVGGRWVVASDGAWVKRMLPQVDLVVYGTAEQRIEAILNPKRWPFLDYTDRTGTLTAEPPLREPPTLDYRLLDSFQEYHPSLEVSRGCGMGCVYCAEAKAPLSEMKPASRVAEELQAYVEAYQATTFHPYLEASYFRPTSGWIASLEQELAKRNLHFSWRTESRVDGLNPDTIARLAKTGLRVLDLGLESASPTQLLAMEKTPKPDVYLRRASELLQACANHGIWVKLNYLLFPGETSKTIAESREWLDHHRTLIKGISANPTIVYRYGTETESYLQQLTKHGAHPVNPTDLETNGYVHLHLSKEIDHEQALAICKQTSNDLMTKQDYLDLKAFSYLPRSYRPPPPPAPPTPPPAP